MGEEERGHFYMQILQLGKDVGVHVHSLVELHELKEARVHVLDIPFVCLVGFFLCVLWGV